MLRVSQTNFSGANTSLGAATQLSRVPLSATSESTLSSASGKSYTGRIFKAVLTPFKCLGRIFFSIGSFVKYFVFCSCIRSRKTKIDWEATREAFLPIFNALTQKNESRKNLLKQFGTWLGNLSAPAYRRFEDYVGYAIALQEHGKLQRADQEKWLKENKNNIHFGSNYFQNLEDTSVQMILEIAARNFQEEIDRK